MSEKESISTQRKSSSDGKKDYGTSCHNDKDVETLDKDLKYPKSVFFIVVNEFCERFSYYGMKAVLTIYLTNVLLFSGDNATVIYHVFSGFCYFTPLFGAMIADSLLGKFRTILYLSIVYAAGNIILSLAASPIGLPATAFSMVGLALIAIGTGGIKPCVSAFGGDQFVLPQQERQLSTFFSIFYFAINAGSLISTFITPIFRKDVQCFGFDTCYPLAFSVPAVLMIVALVIFIIGKPWYTIRQAEGNIVMKVSKCIAHALSRKGTAGAGVRDHWLDYADDVYDSKLIQDIKILIRILVLYIPLPVFWALFDQQGSRWTLQATRMDGEFFGYQVKPDQMQVVNPVLILALIPLFDQIIYPGLAKFNLLKKPLQRLTFGGVLAGIAFIVSGVLELKLDPTYAVQLEPQESYLNFVNTLPCNLTLDMKPELGSRSMMSYENIILPKINATTYDGVVQVTGPTDACKAYGSRPFKFEAESEKAHTYIISAHNGKIVVNRDSKPDELPKDKEGEPKMKVILVGLKEETELNSTLWLISTEDKQAKAHVNLQLNASTVFLVDPKEYQLRLVIPANETINRLDKTMNSTTTFRPRLGGNYVLIVMKNSDGELISKMYTITEPNSVHMFWLLPQYIIITIAEVMFSITGLEFSFAQAPVSMKSVVQAAWLLTVAFGNIIVVVIAKSIKFDKQSKEFFLFAGLMFLDMILFAIMAYFYKPAVLSDNNNESHNTSDIPLDSPKKGRDNESFHKD